MRKSSSKRQPSKLHSANQVEFFCNLSDKTTPLKHFWEHTVGSGHATLALRADWQRQLQQCHKELGFRHVRFHGLLCDDIGALLEVQEKPLYSFFNIDQIFDFILSIGMKPFVELGFMPVSLAAGNKTVFHYRANVTPPKDYKQWDALIGKLASHWDARYGRRGLRDWFFEVWNEPNLKAFWPGTQKEYFKLYRHTVEAIKNVDSSMFVGGPATAKNEWIEDFLEFGEKNALPIDFVSTHHYPTDAFGSLGDDTEQQLAKSRRSILREQAQNVFRLARGRPVYYTEWNASSNPRDPLHDEPYAAAFVTKTIMEANGLVEGYSFWTFTDIFEENYFPSVPFHGGFGLLTLHGIPKPTYRAFQLLHALGTEQLLVDGIHETVNAWIIRKDSSVTILLTNHALPRHSIQAERVTLTLTNARKPHSAQVQRIDDTHANAKKTWQQMHEPEYLNAHDVSHLLGASMMRQEPQPCYYENRTIHLGITLPAQSVAAITLQFRSDR